MAILPPGFISDRSGNFGIMTALLLVPLVGAAGMAVDFAHALSLRTQLYAAADAAAVGSISEKSGAVAAAMSMTGDGTISLGKADARSIFMSQISGELSDVPVDLGIDVTKAANKLNSQVSFTATVPTTFMRVLGRDSISISGTATAEYQTASFMDFYILLDNTPSMGVGATATDVSTMEKTPATAVHLPAMKPRTTTIITILPRNSASVCASTSCARRLRN